MTTYYRCAATIEALQWTGTNLVDVEAFVGRSPIQGLAAFRTVGGYGRLWVAKAKMWADVEFGGWVLAETDGSGFYPCVDTRFADRWAPVEATDPSAGLALGGARLRP